MTTTALHRAAPTRKRYRTASEKRRRHRMTTIVIADVRHGKQRQTDPLMWVIPFTLFVCWAIIGGALWGLSVNAAAPAPVKTPSLESIFGQEQSSLGKLIVLDPSILANLHSFTSIKENHK